jgi:hypothetical protein
MGGAWQRKSLSSMDRIRTMERYPHITGRDPAGAYTSSGRGQERETDNR